MTMPTTAPAPTRATPRLRNGELRRQVAEVLADNASATFTPNSIAGRLGGRSSGAVGNALATLTARGEAEQVTTAPATFRATATTADAARAATVAPRTPAPAPVARTRKTSAATPVIGPVTRPNGQTYHPRALAGLPDVAALRKLREAGVPALMYGPPGTGKTSVVEAAFPDVVTVQGDGDTVVADFLGEHTKTSAGTFEFIHGPLVTAMREGRPLFIDDATLIPPTVLAVVYPAMDGRRQIGIKANHNEIIDATDGFYVVAGHNPGVHGAILSDALSSRFAVQIEVSTDYDLAEQLMVDAKAVRVARNLATKRVSGEVGWVPQLRELLAFTRIAAALGTKFAAGNLIGIAPEDDRDVVAAVVRDVFGTNVSPLALGAQVK
jgi:MoxR-like ATPase